MPAILALNLRGHEDPAAWCQKTPAFSDALTCPSEMRFILLRPRNLNMTLGRYVFVAT